MKRGLTLLGTLLAASAVWAQSSAPNANGSPMLGPATDHYYDAQQPLITPSLAQLMAVQQVPLTIRSGDGLSISVFGVGAYSPNARVSPDGTVELPLLGPVYVRGLTVEQAEVAIARLLAAGNLILNPVVTVTDGDRPNYSVSVAGEVSKPGNFPAYGNHTLNEYLVQAGGQISTAANAVLLTRAGEAAPYLIPLGPDAASAQYGHIPLIAGDEVVVPRIGVFYVVGAVKTQNVFPLKSSTPTTVSQAIAMAGGIGYEAIGNDAQIARTQGNTRILIPVHAKSILHGKEADIALRNDDILFIPTASLKAALKAGGAGFIVSLATLAVIH